VARKKLNTKISLIVFGVLIALVIVGFIIKFLVEWVSANEKAAVVYFVVIGITGLGLFIWWYSGYRKRKGMLFWQLVDAIKKFRYYPMFGKEQPYHAMLYGYLVGLGFRNIKYELSTGWARPDISIKDVAIEVKGPVQANSLQTLADKAIRYSGHYNYWIVVLFEPQYGDVTLDRTINGLNKITGSLGLEWKHITKYSDSNPYR